MVRLICELRYPADCLELEFGYSIGHAAANKKAQIDIKVLDKRRNPTDPATFMLIETKKPDAWETYTSEIEGQLFATGNQEYARGIRYVVWYSVEFAADEMRDRCIVVDFRKFQDHTKWVEAGESGFGFDVPVEYNVVTKHRYVKGKTDLRRNVTRHDLTKLSKDFHNQLWGGGKSGDTAVFNNLIKMLLAKIYDEQNTAEGEAYGFQIEAREGQQESADELVDKVNRLYRKALEQKLGYTPEQAKAAEIDRNYFPPNKVAYVMEQLEGVSVIENTFEDDVLGAFFESIIRTGFKQDKGQFFTHTNIVRFICYALELDTLAVELVNGASPRLPYIMDPSCGSGTFLLEAMKMVTHTILQTRKGELRQTSTIRSFINSNFHPQAEIKNEHNQWAGDYIFGVDGSEDLATATKVNMIMHGDGSANIMKADGLAGFDSYLPGHLKIADTDKNAPYPLPVNGQFDCIISNPPFSLKEDSRTLDEYAKRFLYGGYKNSENLFIERWYQLLREGGRLGVVLPESVFDTNENLYIRVFLYRFFHIRAIVSLPQVTFQPYTPTKTSLLFAQKKTREEVESWDAAWRQAGNEYQKLRNSAVLKYILANDRVRDGLVDTAAKADVEWYPSRNLLSSETLAGGIREQIVEACADKDTLAKRLAALLDEYDKIIADNALNALAPEESVQTRATLSRLLRDRIPPRADTLTLTEFTEAAYDDLVEVSKLNWSDSYKNKPYTNAWWLFSEVTSKPTFDYDIFFAEARQVGYKRSTRHPEGMKRPNDLFNTDAADNVKINEENPTFILEHLRAETGLWSQQR